MRLLARARPLLFAATLSSPAHATTSAHAFTLPFALVDNRVFVEVTLNGSGPFHVILDTGAGAVLSDSTARRLGLDVQDAGEGSGVGAATQHFGSTTVASVKLGTLELSDVAFSVTTFGDTPQVFGRQPVDGIIGAEVFERMVVKHDYVHHILTFTPPDQYRYSGPGTVIPFLRPRNIPQIQASLDSIPGTFGVDTGARSALLLYGPFCETNRLAAKYGARLEGVTGWGIGGPVRSLLARAHTLDLGGVIVHELVIRLSTQKSGATTSSEMAGLIGPDVLSQFDVTFDYARSRIILEKNANYGRRDAYDRAGVWMGQNGAGFKVVDVIAGGPADEAGVHAGDMILAIDGRSTSTLSLPGVREQMRRRAVGDKVKLLLESQGKRRTVILTLRDLA
jgi:hypothetical protein